MVLRKDAYAYIPLQDQSEAADTSMPLKAKLSSPGELLEEDTLSETKDGLSSDIAVSLPDEIDWSPEKEKELVRKLDLLIMPLLIAVFFALQMDRGNIGNALTDNFFEDVGITQDQFNVGQQLHITREEFVRTFSNWRLYPHVILTLAGLAPATTLWSYRPTLTKGFGYGSLVANAMWSIAAWVQLILCLCWGTLADNLGKRGPVVLAGGLIWWIFAICCRCLVYSKNDHLRFGILIIVYGFNQIWHPVNGSWMALNARSAGERSILMTCLIMSANAAGIIGSQLFQSSDKPYYPIGWTAIVVLVTIALIAMVVANLQYHFGNKRFAERGSSFRWQQWMERMYDTTPRYHRGQSFQTYSGLVFQPSSYIRFEVRCVQPAHVI